MGQARVCPFRGIRYNPQVVGDLARVICPPYDVISPEEQKLYFEKSDYNVVRLEYPMDRPDTKFDRYQLAAVTFKRWLEQGVLQVDEISSFYLHEHHFEHLGEKRVRCGLLARVKLEPWGNGIYPHEETSSKAKSDRLNLLRACRANFSPLLALYQDPEQEIVSLLSRVPRDKPLISVSVPARSPGEVGNKLRENHFVWALVDPEMKWKIAQLLSDKSFYVADGHHRYETALSYWHERVQSAGRGQEGENESVQYVLMELVEFSDPGLVILPIHRLVRGIKPSLLDTLSGRLKRFFILEPVPLAGNCVRLPSGGHLGILGCSPDFMMVLTKRPDVSFEAIMPPRRSPVYHDLDVSILNHVVLEEILECDATVEIAYTVDEHEAYQAVRQGRFQLAFLLNPPRLEALKAIVDARDRMPGKSTYFYPKVPAGLIINSFDEGG